MRIYYQLCLALLCGGCVSSRPAGWLEPWTHEHASAAGTPFVHAFSSEPAFLGRDLLVTHVAEREESESEAELEFALTQRIGLVVAGAWVDSETSSGFGDAFVGLRGLVFERERLKVALTAEGRLPTGSEGKGTGTGEWGWAGVVNGWADLGRWVTVQGTAGIERIDALGETAFVWSAALAKSFPVTPLIPAHGDEHGVVAAVSLFAEVAGEDSEGQWLLGAVYSLGGGIDLRAAFFQSFDGDEGWLAGLIWHF